MLLSYFIIYPLPGTHFNHFGISFGVIFATLGPPLEHFGCFFWVTKTTWGARGANRGAKVKSRGRESLFGTPFESLFWRFMCFSQEILVWFHCVFKTLSSLSFSCVFEQVGTVKSIKNTAQGSKNYVCWKSNKIDPEPGLGWIWESFLVSSWWQMSFFVEKMSAGKQSEKRYPRKVKQVPMGRSQGSWTAPLKSKIFWVINNNWTGNNNNWTGNNNGTENTNNSTNQQKKQTIAESLLQFDCCCLYCCLYFLFDFKFNWISKPVIWHALG